MKQIIGTAAALLVALLTTSASAQKGEIAFTGATIETVDKAGRIKNGVVVIRDGKIDAVGVDVKIPDTAKVIDLSGRVIMPGVIDPYHAISLSGGSVSTAPRTIVINGREFRVPGRTVSTTGFARIGENFYPYTFRTRDLLRSGVTHMNLIASGYGQAALVRNSPESPEKMLASSDGVMYAMVTNSSTSLGLFRRGLGTPKPATEPSTTTKPSTTKPTTTTARPGTSTSPAAALWKDVREGKRPLIVNANNSAGIQHLIELLEPHKNVKLTIISTGPNIFQTLETLQSRKPTLILQPIIDLQPNSAIRICVPRLADEAGMKVAFSLSLSRSQLTASEDSPLFRVALLVRAGLKRDVALAALTSRPAEILGLEKTHGSIAKGKLANLLVFDGDPLDPGSQLRQVYVEGSKVYEN